jgi:hypothetical protein
MVTAPIQANYAVSAVRYEEGLVRRVRLHEVRPGGVGPPLEISRAQLVQALQYGRIFVTIRKDESGKFSARDPLRLVTVEGADYLRCDERDHPRDDLFDLPVF